MLGWLKKIFDFVVFTSIFIAICAVLMVYQSYVLFGLKPSLVLMAFVFSGSVCSYNFHWYLTPPHVDNVSVKTLWNINYKWVHLVLFILSLLASAVLAFMLIQHWRWLMVTAFLTFLYSAPKVPHPWFVWLRRIALGKTIFLAFAWTHITSLLPLLVSDVKLGPEHIAFVVNRFYYLYPICIIFDRRDVEDDRKAGIQSLITFLDQKGIDVLFWGCMVAYFISTLIMLLWFSIPVVLALLIPGIVVSALYSPSKKNSSDYLYYFILDGLMMLSAPLLILAKFAR